MLQKVAATLPLTRMRTPPPLTQFDAVFQEASVFQEAIAGLPVTRMLPPLTQLDGVLLLQCGGITSLQMEALDDLTIYILCFQVGKGLSKNGKAQKLALQHSLEAIDPTIRGIDMGTICISIMILDIGEGKEINLEKCPRSKLQNQCIKYLGPQERQQYEVVVESGKLVFKQTGVLVHSSDDFKWIFVLSTTKAFYVGQKNKGSVQHSSFLAGGAITAAGRLVVKDGILKAIWPYNGHYLPMEENFRDFVRYLQENGVDLTDVKKCAIDKDDEYQLLSKLDTQLEQNQNNKAGAAAATVAEDLNKIA
ncbi:hypothetical protein ACQ4PT_023536 [Festuca glaucescens]